MNNYKQILAAIIAANNLTELNSVIGSITPNETEHTSYIKGHLDHINWYANLIGKFDVSKDFCIKLLEFEISTQNTI